jgi:succinate dehydrogenase / fumarate reductase membrane anchor subunit
VFLLYLIISLAMFQPLDYAHWREWVSHDYRHLFIALFFITLMLHAWVGARDVILDYVKPYGLRLLVLICIGLFLLWLLLWAMRTLFMVAA